MYNSSTWKVEAERLEIKGQPQLHSELEANLGCVGRPVSKI